MAIGSGDKVVATKTVRSAGWTSAPAMVGKGTKGVVRSTFAGNYEVRFDNGSTMQVSADDIARA